MIRRSLALAAAATTVASLAALSIFGARALADGAERDGRPPVTLSGTDPGGPPGRYTVTVSAGAAGNTVYDQLTGLTWQQSDLVVSSFSAAASRCAALGAPWRMATLRELSTLMDFGGPGAPAPYIDTTVFNISGYNYQSWSMSLQAPTVYWWVNFQGADLQYEPATAGGAAIRCMHY